MSSDDVAVIGMAGVFPQEARDVDALWDLACRGHRTLCEVPAGRYNVDTFYDPDPARNDTVKMRQGGFIADDPYLFDAGLFGISPAEAASMDPQQRKLLEISFHALEDACLPHDRIAGSRTAVYTAIPASIDWDSISKRDLEVVPKYYAMTNANAMLSNRISHAFDFRGPSATIDTACSSALTAVDLACQALKRGSCDMSVVAGCNLILTPETVSMRGSNAGTLSPDGACHSFDSRASGYGRSEGFAAVVLKPVRQAIRDGNVIRAVIRASATNVDGKTPSFHAPSGAAQAQLIEHTYRLAGLDPSQTGYVEAHGTGTAVGDPIEANAIGEAFQRLHAHAGRKGPLLVGSIKSNIGHMENASGLAALIKTIKMLETSVIPPVADLKTLNSEIKHQEYGLEFPRALRDWPATAHGIRRASINNFGLGGANAHVVLDDAASYLAAQSLHGLHSTVVAPRIPPQITNGVSSTAALLPKLVVLSAADEAGVLRQANQLARHVQQLDPSRDSLVDLCRGLTRSRTNLRWRSFALLDSLASFDQHLEKIFSAPQRVSPLPELSWVFTGQGAIRPQMGRDLLCFEPYRESLQAADKVLKPLGLPESVLDVLDHMTQAELNQPLYSQTICTVVQVALVDFLRAVGAQPQHVVGHSSGEIAAAYAAGALTREAAWKVAYFRGRSLQTVFERLESSEDQGMMVTQLARDKAQVHIDNLGLGQSLWVACANSDSSSTISGLQKPLITLQEALTKQGILAKRLDVVRAYHTPLMHAVGEEYKRLLSTDEAMFDGATPTVGSTMYSSVTGQAGQLALFATAAYWVRNLVSPVDFAGAVKALQRSRKEARAEGQLCFVEVGPHASLRRPVLDGSVSLRLTPRYSSCLQRGVNDRESFLTMAGELFTQGIVVDLDILNGATKTHGPPRPNLPKYVFNHTARLADASRLDEVFRFGKRKRVALLGTPEVDWNKEQPSWRLVIRKNEYPWIADHKVNAKAIFPAAGFSVMAIEAARQLAPANAKYKGVTVRNLSCDRPLAIHDAAQSAEVRLSLFPRNDHPSRDFPSYDFVVYGEEDGDWYKMSSGNVQLQAHRANDLKAQASDAANKTRRDVLVNQGNSTSTEATQYYDHLADYGVQFGSTFQQLDQISSTEIEGHPSATAMLKPDILEQSRHYEKSPSQCLIHPTILDAAIQMPMAVLTKAGTSPMATTVVRGAQEIWISADLMHLGPDSKLDLSCEQVQDGFRQKLYNADMVQTESGSKMVSVTHLAMTDLLSSLGDQMTTATPPIYFMNWQPSLANLSAKEAGEYFESRWPSLPDPAKKETCMSEALSIYFARRAMAHLKQNPPGPDTPYYRTRWFNAMTDFAQRPLLQDVVIPSEEEVQLLAKNADSSSPMIQMTLRLGKNIESVLEGAVDPLHLIFSDSLIQQFYAVGLASETFKVADYVAIMVQNKPGLRVLEIGAGTGSATNEVVKASLRVSAKPFAQYTYTDVSSAFFAKAAERFGSQVPEMEYRKLDISTDLLEQGFVPDNYDLVIAGSVMHVAADISRAVTGVSKLLRPGGKFILVEPTNLQLVHDTFLFGSLPSWWTGSELAHQDMPILSEPRWDSLLRACGLSGIDFVSRDFKDWDLYNLSTIITSKPAEAKPVPTSKPVVILLGAGQKKSPQVASLFQERLQQAGVPVMLSSVDRNLDFTGKLVISLLDVEDDFLGHQDAAHLEVVQKLSSNAESILWISQNAGDAYSSPEKSKIEGLSRVVCTERDEDVFTVARFPGSTSAADIVAKSFDVVAQMLEAKPAELQYNEHDGILTCGRLTTSTKVSSELHDRAQAHQARSHRIGAHPKDAISLTTKAAGSLSAFEFIENHEFKSPPQGDEVDIEVFYAGLNFHDVVVALGQLPDTVLGLDGAGIVRRAGPDAHFAVGDQVAFYTTNCMSTYVRCTSLDAHAIPAGTTLATAAALPGVACTAYVTIHQVARLQRGERVLIHAAAGGLGQVAIQLAQLAGADIFATVSSPQKRQVLIDHYGISPERVFYSRDASFADDIRRLTSNEGVDVVINSLSGQLLQESFALLRPFGRFVEVGKKDINSNSSLQMAGFGRGAMFAAVDLSMPEAAPMRRAAWHDFVKLMREHPGKVHEPRPLHIVAASEVESAFRMLQSGNTAGKVLVEFKESDQVQLRRSSTMRLQLDPNATYVVAGGFGGVGQCIVQWLAKAGARHILVLTRRSLDGNAEAEAFVQEIRLLGAAVTLARCDIADVETLTTVVHDANARAPIKGCVQCAMMLDDQSFSKMTLDQFKGPLAPKEKGSWNLHQLLPQGLEFFVMLSSLSGQYGIHGQAAYAAGNTFQDALARHRRSLGERAISIDLGAVADAGYMLYGKTIGVFDKAVTESIFVAELLLVLDIVCQPEYCDGLSPQESHVVLGITHPLRFKQAGKALPGWLSRPAFQHLHGVGENKFDAAADAKASAAAGSADYTALVKGAETEDAAEAILIDALQDRLCKIMALSKADVDMSQPFHTFGVDSLVAIELRHWFLGELHQDVKTSEFLNNNSMASLCSKTVQALREDGDGAK